jgi:pimeloyl-ACP methyl ester carboxylesterase
VSRCSDHTAKVGGVSVFWRSAPAPHAQGVSGDGDLAPRAVNLYLHGVPSSSVEWLAFLERGGGVAVDLPGFGRSGKPAWLAYTISEYEVFIERFLAEIEAERVNLVVHDWGAVGLAFAQRHPERVGRLVIINSVPLLPGYRWHRIARLWRTPRVGELAMRATGRPVLRLLTRESNVTPGPMPEQWLASVYEHLDEGTRRAILRLYRSSPPAALEAAGARLGQLRMPALVAWGMRDPYIPARFGREYAQALGGGAELLELADAGHWPWLDRPELIDRVVDFLSAA